MHERRRSLLAAISSANAGSQRDIETPNAPQAESLSQSRRGRAGIAERADVVMADILNSKLRINDYRAAPISLRRRSLRSPTPRRGPGWGRRRKEPARGYSPQRNQVTRWDGSKR